MKIILLRIWAYFAGITQIPNFNFNLNPTLTFNSQPSTLSVHEYHLLKTCLPEKAEECEDDPTTLPLEKSQGRNYHTLNSYFSFHTTTLYPYKNNISNDKNNKSIPI